MECETLLYNFFANCLFVFFCFYGFMFNGRCGNRNERLTDDDTLRQVKNGKKYPSHLDHRVLKYYFQKYYALCLVASLISYV